jgi:hypothetical protein
LRPDPETSDRFASRVRGAKTGESEGNGFAERNQRFPALRRKASESSGAKSGDFAGLLVFNELTDIWVRVVSCEGASGMRGPCLHSNRNNL